MIYDVKTKNKSFLKTAIDLKKLDVKNNKFFLLLLDESLQGVDPHSTNLTDEQQLRIYIECCKNKWYFLREVVRVPVAGAERGIPYGMNLGNLTLSYLKLKNKNQIMMLPRQHGKTIGEVCDDIWVMDFATSNTNMLYFNKEYKDSKENLFRFKNIRLLLPGWMQDKFLDSKKDVDNQERKVRANKNNTLRAMPTANSEDSADKLGRGATVALVYYDEFA